MEKKLLPRKAGRVWCCSCNCVFVVVAVRRELKSREMKTRGGEEASSTDNGAHAWQDQRTKTRASIKIMGQKRGSRCERVLQAFQSVGAREFASGVQMKYRKGRQRVEHKSAITSCGGPLGRSDASSCQTKDHGLTAGKSNRERTTKKKKWKERSSTCGVVACQAWL